MHEQLRDHARRRITRWSAVGCIIACSVVWTLAVVAWQTGSVFIGFWGVGSVLIPVLLALGLPILMGIRGRKHLRPAPQSLREAAEQQAIARGERAVPVLVFDHPAPNAGIWRTEVGAGVVLTTGALQLHPRMQEALVAAMSAFINDRFTRRFETLRLVLEYMILTSFPQVVQVMALLGVVVALQAARNEYIDGTAVATTRDPLALQYAYEWIAAWNGSWPSSAGTGIEWLVPGHAGHVRESIAFRSARIRDVLGGADVRDYAFDADVPTPAGAATPPGTAATKKPASAAVAFVIAALFSLGAGAMLLASGWDLSHDGRVETKGVVVERFGPYREHASVEFQDTKGVRYEFDDYNSDHAVGTELIVRYDPGAPEDDPTIGRAYPGLAYLGGAACCVVGVALLIGARRSQARSRRRALTAAAHDVRV